jgi:hypothetical protein
VPELGSYVRINCSGAPVVVVVDVDVVDVDVVGVVGATVVVDVVGGGGAIVVVQFIILVAYP